MKWLKSIALVAGIVWLIALTALTVRFIVDAPWEENPQIGEQVQERREIGVLLCKDALERRQMIEAALIRDTAGSNIPLRNLRSMADEVTRLRSSLESIQSVIAIRC